MATNDNNLSWQSAFWAIVPIALTTMMLPSGKVLGFPSKYNFALRASPIVCAASAVDSVVRLIIYTRQTKSLGRGMERWVAIRFEDRKEPGEGTFDAMRQNRFFLLLSFAIGFTQALKLFAVRGIPWTQFACAAYVASFVVDAAIILTTSERSTDHSVAGQIQIRTNVDGMEISRLYKGLVLWCSIIPVHGCFFFDMIVYETFASRSIRAFLQISYGLLMMACGLPQEIAHRRDWRLSSTASTDIVVLVARGALVGSGIGWALSQVIFYKVEYVKQCSATGCQVSINAHDVMLVDLWDLATSLPWLLVIFLFFPITAAIIGFGRQTLMAEEHNSKLFDVLFGRYYVLLHLLLALCCYWSLYNPTTTYKPTWTESLG